jgi:hypothetical protein
VRGLGLPRKRRERSRCWQSAVTIVAPCEAHFACLKILHIQFSKFSIFSTLLHLSKKLTIIALFRTFFICRWCPAGSARNLPRGLPVLPACRRRLNQRSRSGSPCCVWELHSKCRRSCRSATCKQNKGKRCCVWSSIHGPVFSFCASRTLDDKNFAEKKIWGKFPYLHYTKLHTHTASCRSAPLAKFSKILKVCAL